MRMHVVAAVFGCLTFATIAHAQPPALTAAEAGPAAGDVSISVAGSFNWLLDGNMDAAAGGELDVGRRLGARTYIGAVGELNRVVGIEASAPSLQLRGGLELRYVLVDQQPFADACGSYGRSTISLGLRGGVESLDGNAPGEFVDATIGFDGWNYEKWGHGFFFRGGVSIQSAGAYGLTFDFDRGHDEPTGPVSAYLTVGYRITSG